MRHPNFVIFYVKDPGVSTTFYSRLLGSDPVEASSTFVMFALESGIMFGLWIRSEVVPSVQSPPGAAELAITLKGRAEVESAFEDWRAAGVEVALEPTRLDFGYGFAIRDPDGHIIRVFDPSPAVA
jgi:catechol 2,3-dioxygenase-like lactoylglutathione lyase family enzyme